MTETKSEEKAKILLEWQAPEFAQVERKMGWYVIGTVVFVVLLALMIFWQQWILAILVVLVAVVVLQYSFMKPRLVDFHITSGGLEVGEKFYKFLAFKSFSISKEVQTVTFERKRRLGISLVWPLPKDGAEKVRKALADFLPEIERPESAIDHLSRLLKF